MKMRTALFTLLATLAAGTAFATDYVVDTYPASASNTIAGVIEKTLQNAATVGNGSTYNTKRALGTTLLTITWGAGTTAGAVTVESAATASYSGTWAPLATVSWTDASSQDIVQISGAVNVVRARISTDVVTGSALTIPSANVNTTTNVVQTTAPHGWLAGQKLIYQDGGSTSMTYATGVSLDGTVCYVKTVPANDTFTLSLTAGGAELDIDGAGNNAQTFAPGGTVTVIAGGK